MRLSSTLTTLAVLSVSLFANAQAAPTARRSRAPKRPAAREVADACVPDCRSGYTCVEGQCVSKCNPLCGEGERCTDGGECEPVATSDEPEGKAEQAERAQPKVAAPFDRGEGGGPASSESVPVRPDERLYVRRHDGFYLRMGLGPAALSGSTGSTDGRDLTGLGGAFELAIGGTVGRGVVIGAANLPSVYNIKATYDGNQVDDSYGYIGFVGPFVDWYLNPSKGLHLEAAAGLASVLYDAPQVQPGIGLMLGGGYEWWVGDQWSIGLLGRINVTGVEDVSATTYSTLITFTYH